MQIHIQRNGQQYGPYTVEELDGLLQSESLTGEDFYWHEGREDWAPLSQFPGFTPAPSPAAPPPPLSAAPSVPPPVAPKPTKNSMGKIVGVSLFVIVIGGCLYLVLPALKEMNDLPPAPSNTTAVPSPTGAQADIIEVMFTKTAPTTAANFLSVTSQVTNRSPQAIPQLFFTVRALDPQGVVLADRLEKVDNLAPGQTAQITTTFSDVPYEKLGKLDASLKNVWIDGYDRAGSFQAKVIPFDEAAGNVLSIEAAQKAAVGVWTGRKSDLCLRLVFKEDRTYEEYTPLISADGWGESHRGTWEAFTGKYDDTGKRYYGVRLSDGGHVIVETTTQMRHPNLEVSLTKGDTFPFSK